MAYQVSRLTWDYPLPQQKIPLSFKKTSLVYPRSDATDFEKTDQDFDAPFQ